MQIAYHILAELNDHEVPANTRYTFTLRGIGSDPLAGIIERRFTIDVPHDESGSTDVWVHDSTVAVGDTPADGFATFTPARAWPVPAPAPKQTD